MSSSSLVRVEGAWYSVPCDWARLDATALVGPESVEVICRGEQVTHPRQRFGGRAIKRRHYLKELAKKPQAVRQVAPELVAELGEPFGQLWALLSSKRGGHDGARVLARIIEAITEHGEEQIRTLLQQALEGDASDILYRLPRKATASAPETIDVPAALAGYEVETARAADYDVLLLEVDHAG